MSALAKIVEQSFEASNSVLDASVKLAEQNIKAAALFTDLAQKQAQLVHQQTEIFLNSLTGFSMLPWISNVMSKTKP